MDKKAVSPDSSTQITEKKKKSKKRKHKHRFFFFLNIKLIIANELGNDDWEHSRTTLFNNSCWALDVI